jgi:putative sterol carrier protein
VSIEADRIDPSSLDPSIDPSAIDPAEFARSIGKTPDEELRKAMSGPLREQILAEIFRRMEQHYRPRGSQDAVIHWTITGGPDDDGDRWEVALAGSRCAPKRGHHAEPRVALTLDAVDFLRLVTGNAIGPMLFMSGKLKIEGDLMFAAQIQSMFEIPG